MSISQSIASALSFVLSIVAFGNALTFADESRSSEVDHNETPLLEFSATPIFRAGQYVVDLDAGSLAIDSKYRICVTIKSPLEEEMAFRGLKTSCSCFDAKASSMVLHPNDEILLDFTAPVPKKSVHPDAFWRVRLEPDSDSDLGGIAVVIRYKVAGLLGFINKRVVLESNRFRPVNQFQIPMILSKPVEAKNVVVQLPDSFRDMKASVLSDKNGDFLSLELSPELAETQYIAGEITCVDSVTGIEDVVYCVIRTKTFAAVFPGILRAQTEPDSGGFAVISAIIRVDADKERDAVDPKDKKPGSAIIDATYEGKPLELELSPLSATTYRVKIKLPKATIQTMKQTTKAEIHWIIRTKEENCELRSVVSFVE